MSTLLTEKQLQAIALLTAGKTHKEVAAAVGVTKRTITRWVADPNFFQSIQPAQTKVLESIDKELTQSITDSIERLIPKAINLLEECLDSPDTRTSDRLRAAQLLGNWSGLSQPQQKAEVVAPEQNLKDYVAYLSLQNNAKSANNN